MQSNLLLSLPSDRTMTAAFGVARADSHALQGLHLYGDPSFCFVPDQEDSLGRGTVLPNWIAPGKLRPLVTLHVFTAS